MLTRARSFHTAAFVAREAFAAPVRHPSSSFVRTADK